jgi:DNA-binding CsgD family transcriptional regulator
LVPGSRSELKWWPALVLLVLVGASWLVYKRQQYLGQLLFNAPGMDKLLNLKQNFSSQQQQLAEAEPDNPEEEIPVDEGKLDQLSSLHLMKLLTEEDWNLFLLAFDEIYPGFHWRLRLKVNDISPAELRLMCLIRLHLNSREISRRLGISQQSVNIARYRLRRKLGLEHHERLEEFVLTL